jgi:hypothetical protein
MVVKFFQMDVNSPECEMKNDREIDRMAINLFIEKLPKLTELRELSIQWHKLNTNKSII